MILVVVNECITSSFEVQFIVFRKKSICQPRCYLRIQCLSIGDMSSKLLKRNDTSHAKTKYWNHIDTSLRVQIEYHILIKYISPKHSVNL
jgi:hypothetical protein